MTQTLLLLFHVAAQPVVVSVFGVVGDQPRFVRALGHVVPPDAAVTVTEGAEGAVSAWAVATRACAVVTPLRLASGSVTAALVALVGFIQAEPQLPPPTGEVGVGAVVL